MKVAGDPESVEFEGYTCPKGRALPEQLYDPARLLHSMKRDADGQFDAIPSQTAIDEIAATLKAIIDQHGPRSVAIYQGTGSMPHPFGNAMGAAFLSAIGSPNFFSAATIDKPADLIAPALHGNWMAGAQSFASADTWLIVGANPVIAKSAGAPNNNPGMRLKEAVGRGMKLIVIDPRRTETAKRAHIHLQARPGEDAAILACFINIILRENLYDQEFVAANARGIETLRSAVADFTPGIVAAQAGIEVADLLSAARIFGSARSGGVQCATGPSFSMHSNLSFYLAMCLITLCGRWAREGEIALHPNVLLPAFEPKAQPYPPFPVFGDIKLRVHGMRQNASGMPTAALADEILLEGEGQIKALICLGSNPMSAWPDQRKTEAALRSLDLLVSLDITMCATARLAHYVIPPPLPLELPGITYFPESTKYYGPHRGYHMPWAQYSEAVIAPPSSADLIQEYAFFFRIAKKMGLQLELAMHHGHGPHLESPTLHWPLDMDDEPSLDEIFVEVTRNSRVPLDEVKRHPHGHKFDIKIPIAGRDEDCDAFLELGDPMMMAELGTLLSEVGATDRSEEEFPYRLISRRTNNFMNSAGIDRSVLHRGKQYNPAHVHSQDMSELGLKAGDIVEVRSRHGMVLGVVEADDTLRPGVIAMSHGFGTLDLKHERSPHGGGSNLNQIIHVGEHDPISGIPRMSAIAVSLEKLERTCPLDASARQSAD